MTAEGHTFILQQAGLGDVYRRAAVTFKDQLQQNFVGLHDSCPPCETPWIRGQNRAGAEGLADRPKIKRKF